MRGLLAAMTLGSLALLLGGCGKADEPGTKTTESGLKYRDIVEGEGKAAQKGDDVFVVYTGRLSNGTRFDGNSAERPFIFTLGARRVIKGWDEGIVGMKVGGKRKLIIPSDLGYGAEGSPPEIPGNAELHFDVELLKIE